MLENRLKICKSDLADLNNPKLMMKYPHLNNDDLRKQLKTSIDQIQERLNEQS